VSSPSTESAGEEDLMEALDQHVLSAARTAIAGYGWRGATLARIAETAGVSRMTLHRRGVTRAAIIDALGGEIEAAYREAFWPALTSPDGALDRLRMALLAQCDVEERFLDVSGALEAAEQDLLFHERGAEAATRDAFIAPLRRILADGVSERALATPDAAQTATVLFNLVSSTYRHLRVGHRWSADHAAVAVVEVALHGVAV
jgi:AcrR family transcriptional regulator